MMNPRILEWRCLSDVFVNRNAHRHDNRTCGGKSWNCCAVSEDGNPPSQQGNQFKKII